MEDHISNSDTEIDWDNLNKEIAEIIYLNGRGYIETQIQISIAADQRSMTLAGILMGFATAIMGISLGLISSGRHPALAVAALTAGLFLATGAWCALWASRPGEIYYPHVKPAERLHNTPWLKTGKTVALISEAFNQQERIEGNERTLASLHKWYRDALQFTAAAPIAGVVVWVAAKVWAA